VQLDVAIPERAAAFTAANAAAASKKEPTNSDASARKRSSTGPIAQSVELRTFKPGGDECADIARTIRLAAEGGRWELAERLAALLGARS
jgi:hypothetical protein